MSKIAAFGNEDSLFQTKQSNKTNDIISDYMQNGTSQYQSNSFQTSQIYDANNEINQHSNTQKHIAQMMNSSNGSTPYENKSTVDEQLQAMMQSQQQVFLQNNFFIQQYQNPSPSSNITNYNQFLQQYQNEAKHEQTQPQSQQNFSPVVIADFIKQSKQLQIKENPPVIGLQSAYEDQDYSSISRSQPESIKNSNLNQAAINRIVTHQGVRQRSISNMRDLKNRSATEVDYSQVSSNPQSKQSSYYNSNSNYSNAPSQASKYSINKKVTSRAMLNQSQAQIPLDNIQAKIVVTDFMNNLGNNSTSDISVNLNSHKRSSSTAQQINDSNLNNKNISEYTQNLPLAAEQTCQTLNSHFCIEMGKAKPKILKNLNSLYQVFVPQVKKQTNSASVRKNSDLRHAKNRSMDTTNPQYYITFNKDSNSDSQKFASQLNHHQLIIDKEQSQRILNKELQKSRQDLSTGISQQQSLNIARSQNGTRENLENESMLKINQMLKNLSPDRGIMQHHSQNEMMYNQNEYFDNTVNDQEIMNRNIYRKNSGQLSSFQQSRDQKKYLNQIFWQSQSQQINNNNTQSATNIVPDSYMLSPQLISAQKQSRHHIHHSQDQQQLLSNLSQPDFPQNISQEFIVQQEHSRQSNLQQVSPQPSVNQIFSSYYKKTNSSNNNNNNQYANTFGSSHKKVTLNNESINNYETEMQIQSTATFSQLLQSQDRDGVKETPRIGEGTVKKLIK